LAISTPLHPHTQELKKTKGRGTREKSGQGGCESAKLTVKKEGSRVTALNKGKRSELN